MGEQAPRDGREFAEGTYEVHGRIRASLNDFSQDKLYLPPVFRKFAVLDVIFDPYIINDEKITQLQRLYGDISNVQHLKGYYPPRNSIIARPLIDLSHGNRQESLKTMVLYPFFPSHISMPCKPGEHVWVMFEYLTERKSIGYWVCRIVGPDHIDDVNYSHAPREHDFTFQTQQYKAGDVHENSVKPKYHFKNGVYTNIKISEQKQELGIDLSKATLTGDENEYEKILSTSDGANASVFEPVPRFKKRPGDLVLEGSNNTLIVLGRDRNGSATTYSIDPSSESAIVRNSDLIEDISRSGTIDIVAGRGMTASTSGKKIENEFPLGTKNSAGEIAKDHPSLSPQEGDPNFQHDRSRIYVSQRTKVDSNLGINVANSKLKPPVQDDVNGDSAIIIKSDKIRIVARSDVQLLVTGYKNSSDLARAGLKDENEAIDSKKWASITIKSNGDIVFTPSDEGYIKLGGDDANRGIVCTALPVNATQGGVSAPSIITTSGGQIGGAKGGSSSGNQPLISPLNGTYANKVLIK